MPHTLLRQHPPRPLRERSLAVVRWLVVVLAVIELVDLLSGMSGPVRWVVVLLGFAATVTVLWSLRWGLVLGAAPIAAFLLLGDGGGFLTLIVVTFRVALRGSRRLVVGYTVALGTLLVTDALLHPEAGRTILLVALAAVFGATAAVVRLLLRRSSRAEQQIVSLAERVARVRDDERSVLADELADLLSDSLTDNQHTLAQADATRTADARQALATVEAASRTALTRLRGLVATLRGAAPDDQGTATLLQAVENTEDALTEHGYTVELELPNGDAEVLLDPATVVRLLEVAARRARDEAPPGATCRLEVTRTSLVWSHPLADDPRADDPDLDDLAETASRAGASLTHTVRDGGWTVAYHVRDASTAPVSGAGGGTTSVARGTRHWSTWIRPGMGRMALTLPAVVGAVHTGAVTLEQWRLGQPWQEPATWTLTWLGVCLLAHVPWASALLLLAALTAGAVIVPPTPVAFAAPHIAYIALTGLVTSRAPRLAWLPVVGWVAYVVVWYRGVGTAAPHLGTLLVHVALGLFVGLAAHHFVAVRDHQMIQLQRLEQAHATAREDERRQLAGELHDVLAHQLSLITMRVAACGDATDPAVLGRALDDVEGINASARADLGTLTTIMRTHTGSAPSGPQHSWLTPRATAETVADALREAGHTVDLDLHPDTDAVDPTTARTLTRILREASTNILRYAPAASEVAITTSITHDRAIVQVTNPLGTSTPVSPDSTGWGLLGLAERAHLTGGTFHGGPVDGQWVVQATLPRHATTGPAPGPRPHADTV